MQTAEKIKEERGIWETSTLCVQCYCEPKIDLFFFKKKQRQKSQNIIVYTYTHISMCIYLIMNHMKPAVVE